MRHNWRLILPRFLRVFLGSFCPWLSAENVHTPVRTRDRFSLRIRRSTTLRDRRASDRRRVLSISCLKKRRIQNSIVFE